jgi:hypothetical protein
MPKKQRKTKKTIIDDQIRSASPDEDELKIIAVLKENDILTHKVLRQHNLTLCDLSDYKNYDRKYECPRCKTIITLAMTTRCHDCDKYMCDDCIRYIFIPCSDSDCHYCKRGSCFNNRSEISCKKCWKDPLEKYKDAPITEKILQKIIKKKGNACIDNCKVDREPDYKYECTGCLKIINFGDVTLCCNCKSHICSDCLYATHFPCEKIGCKYCKKGICYYATVDIHCAKCINLK